jgi:hypothetical protein
MQKRIDGDWIPIGDYESLIKRIKWSERLNLVLFMAVLVVAFGAFIAVGAHTYQYEKRLGETVKTFKEDLLAVTGDQNIAINELNKVVLDRNWVNYQRVTLEQLKGFCDLRDEDPEAIVIENSKGDEGVGGK